MRATDPDCGVNAMVNYTLAAGRMESEQLMVRSDTGDICVRTPLDRETAPYLEIPVIATDRGMYTYIYMHSRNNIRFHSRRYFTFLRETQEQSVERKKVSADIDTPVSISLRLGNESFVIEIGREGGREG